MLCSSCKNKSSIDQCTSTALKGFLFCGKHLKMRNKKLWSVVCPNRKYAILIQKIWRGYFFRKWLKLCGSGVLNRSVCHNEEELVTLESKNAITPTDYFSITESEKVYWFNVISINQWTRNNMTNPYTRQPFAIDDRIRLRELCRIRRKFNFQTLNNSDNSIAGKWVEICHIIEENGFFDMDSLFFQDLSKTGLFHLTSIILKDLIAYTSGNPRRQKYVDIIKSKLQKAKSVNNSFSESLANALLLILYDCPNNYDICFIIVSARCRL